MLDPSVIQTAIVAKLRAIPTLVTLVGGVATNIDEYPDTWPNKVDTGEAIQSMVPPAIMVFYQGSEPGDFGEARPWKHRFSLVLMASGKVGTLAAGVINGLDGSGIPFLEQEVLAGLDPAETPIIQRQSLDYGDSVFEYFEILLTYVEQFNR